MEQKKSCTARGGLRCFFGGPKSSVLLFSLAGLTLVCSCRPRADYAQKLISKPGTFSCFHEAIRVKVLELPNHLLNYAVATRRAEFGPSQGALRTDQSWLVYAESPSRVWVFDGEKTFTLLELTGDAAAKFTSSQVVSNLAQEAPPILKQRL
jgi:hypothetical protein